MHVEHDGGDEHGKADEEHGEKEILAEKWHGERGARDDLGYEQEEHGLRQQDRDTQGDLLPRVGGQVEHQDWQVRNAHRRDYQVHCVEERAPAERDVEKDVGIRLQAARVEFLVTLRWNGQNVPLDGRVVLPQVDPDIHHVFPGLLVDVLQINLRGQNINTKDESHGSTFQFTC